jgi:hypothetical protein
MKPLLVGESNPYQADPYYALYPAPDGCAGHRLCCLILGMRRQHYLDEFERVNLCAGKWSIREARARASDLQKQYDRLILLGSKVASAFGCKFTPFQVMYSESATLLVLPHPSGLCRLWSQPNAIFSARVAVLSLAPELIDLLGKEKP